VIHEKLKEAFLQGEEKEAVRLFQDLMQRAVRLGLYEAMQSEVEMLCGPRYRPDAECSCRRAGSEHGIAYLNGGKEELIRPRVREKDGGEVRLSTYEAASSPLGLFDQVVAAVGQGLAIRGAERAMDKALSKSEISRMWVDKSREQLEVLRSRALDKGPGWIAVIIDGVWLGDICVVVAVGVDLEGNKRVLDFEQGPSENTTTVATLIGRLKSRGVEPADGYKLLVLRDGSPAIAAGVRREWPTAIQQECLVHSQSNVRDKVRKRDRADVDRHYKALREAEGREAGEEAFADLVEFVSERNAAAALTLADNKDALIAFHRLNVPSTLNTTFLSTNLIENVFRNWREATGNIKRWSEKEDMVPRWMAAGLLWAEAGFRKIRHAEDLPRLAAALALSTPSSAPAHAVASSSVPSASAEQLEACHSTSN
jgi:transposase-like protein